MRLIYLLRQLCSLEFLLVFELPLLVFGLAGLDFEGRLLPLAELKQVHFLLKLLALALCEYTWMSVPLSSVCVCGAGADAMVCVYICIFSAGSDDKQHEAHHRSAASAQSSQGTQREAYYARSAAPKLYVATDSRTHRKLMTATQGQKKIKHHAATHNLFWLPRIQSDGPFWK